MATIRKDPLVNGEYYHIYTRSISGFQVFNNPEEYSRMMEYIELFQFENFNYKYTDFKRLDLSVQTQIRENLKLDEKRVQVVAYCLMPTHLHMVLKQNTELGISKYMGKVLDSYSKYFNNRHKRFGPLWSSRFKNLLVNNDEQLLHLTRYIHLNPTSAGLINNPEEWAYSSLSEFIETSNFRNKMCEFNGLFDFTPENYKAFVADKKDYQKNLSVIKSLMLDDYFG